MLHIFMQHLLFPSALDADRLYKFLLHVCLQYLYISDVYWRRPGQSGGCDEEERICRLFGIPIVYSEAELNAWIDGYETLNRKATDAAH
jgi:hypothetical protein